MGAPYIYIYIYIYDISRLRVKTQSLQHLKPIKCQKRVCKYKTPTRFGLFHDELDCITSVATCTVRH